MTDKLKFTVVGLKRLEDRIGKRINKADKNIVEQVNASAVMVHRDAVKSIANGQPQGKFYSRDEGRRIHQASAPGQPPASDSSNLVNRIHVEYANAGEDTALVKSQAAYAAALEFGTRKMEARPYLKPALDRNLKTIRKNISDAVKRSMEV